MFLCSAKSTHFVSNFKKNGEYAILGNTLRLFQHYMGGIFSIYYNITIVGEGSTETPNLDYVINGLPLISVMTEIVIGRG